MKYICPDEHRTRRAKNCTKSVDDFLTVLNGSYRDFMSWAQVEYDPICGNEYCTALGETLIYETWRQSQYVHLQDRLLALLKQITLHNYTSSTYYQVNGAILPELISQLSCVKLPSVDELRSYSNCDMLACVLPPGNSIHVNMIKKEDDQVIGLHRAISAPYVRLAKMKSIQITIDCIGFITDRDLLSEMADVRIIAPDLSIEIAEKTNNPCRDQIKMICRNQM